MKIVLALFIAILVLSSNHFPADAKDTTEGHTVDKYVKPDDILIALIAPKIDEVIKAEYKDRPAWNLAILQTSYSKVTLM